MLYVPIDENNFAIVELIAISEPDENWRPYIHGFDGLYKPMWSGDKWVEGLSLEEIEEIRNKPVEPSEKEILDHRIKQLELDNATIAYDLMLERARNDEHDHDIATLYYEIMTGGV